MTPQVPIPSRRMLVGVVAFGGLLAGCATGDGTTLRPPPPGQTAPPPTTEAPEDDTSEGAAVDEFGEGTDTLASVPLTTAVRASPVGDVTIAIPADADSTTFAAFAPWADGLPIEPTYTCAGRNVSPPVSWTGLPASTQQVAIVMVDEATVQRGRSFVHWVLTGIPSELRTLTEGEVPLESSQAINYYGNIGYDGPCPPPGERHDYLLTVHALSAPVDVADGTPADEVVDAIDAVSIDSVTLVGSVSN